MIEKWDNRFLELAKHISTWSKDPSTQVGAVITDKNRRVVSIGYNGFPIGVKDKLEYYNDRDKKYPRIVHGELNAILSAKCDLSGHTIYLWPFLSCSTCTGAIIQSGIKTVVAPENDNPRWKDSFIISKEMLTQAGVKYILYDMKMGKIVKIG